MRKAVWMVAVSMLCSWSPVSGQSAGSRAKDWPMYKGNPARTGFLPNAGIARPAMLWHRRLPQKISCPVVSGGVLYIVGGNNLYGFDAKTGQEKFKTPGFPGKYPYTSTGLVPTVDGKNVFVGTQRGLVVADATTGQVQWRLDGGPISSVVCAEGKALFTRATGELVCVDIAGQKIAWTYKSGGPCTGSPALADGLVCFVSEGEEVQARKVVDGRVLAYKVANGKVHAVKLADGSAGWVATIEKAVAGEGSFPNQTPAIADGVLYVGYGGSDVMALDAKTGKQKWTTKVGHCLFRNNSPVVGLGIVSGGGKGWGVLGIDPADGKKLWRMDDQPGLPPHMYTSATNCFANDGLYVVDNYGTTTVFALDARTGLARWLWRTDWRRACGHPAVADGVMYFACVTSWMKPQLGGHLYAIADESALGKTEDVVALAGDKSKDLHQRAGAWEALAHRDPALAAKAIAAALGEGDRASSVWAMNTIEFYMKGKLAGLEEVLGEPLVKVVSVYNRQLAKTPDKEDAINRVRACHALGEMKYAKAAAALDQAVEGDPNGLVWPAALSALVKIQGKRSLPTFLRALDSKVEPVGVYKPGKKYLPRQAARILLTELAQQKMPPRAAAGDLIAKAKEWAEKNRQQPRRRRER